MPPGPMKPDELRRYADMIVRGCIAFRRGDTLLEMVSFGHRDLAVAIAEAAYRAGALAVDVAYDDNRVYAAKIQHAQKNALGHQTPWKAAQWRAFGEESVAIVQVMGEYELDVVADLSPERVAADNAGRNRYVARIRREARLRGTICAWPTDAWATRVFPALDVAKAKRKLAQDLLWFCRLGPGDPPGHKGWTQHLAALRRRAARLTKLDLKEVHIIDDGLLDENAAAHMAFGSGFAKTRTVPIGRKRHGVNRSKTHIDVMIGTDALNAFGVTQSGRRVPLVADGAWQF